MNDHNGNTASLASGTRYSLTPIIPAAPTNLTFTSVTSVSMTLNWTDNATNEVGYVVYSSTDGVTYSLVTQLPANATSLTQSLLAPTTAYSWIVYAITEGGLSSPLAGSQTTPTPGRIKTTGSGNWSSHTHDAPWPGGIIPTASDSVIIADGSTVTINTAASCWSLNVGQGTSGVLRYETSSAETLSVGSHVTIASGATFSSALSGPSASCSRRMKTG